VPVDARAVGLLTVVLPKGALFAPDDLALLRIRCSEAAVQLDHPALPKDRAGNRKLKTAD
jgi:hypothetical protein